MGRWDWVEGAWDRGFEVGRGFVKGGGELLGVVVDLKNVGEDLFDGEFTDAANGLLSSLTTRPVASLGHVFGPDTGMGALIGGIPQGVREPVRSVLDPVFEGSEIVRDYVFDRPMSTLVTMGSYSTADDPTWMRLGRLGLAAPTLGLSLVVGADTDVLFDLEKWRQTWNHSKSRSFGQSVALYSGAIDLTDPDEVDKFLGTPYAMLVSGTLDATSAIIVDPLNLLSGVGAVRKGTVVLRAGADTAGMGGRATRLLQIGSRRQAIYPTRSLLPENLGPSSLRQHVFNGFKLSEDQVRLIGRRRLDNSEDFENTVDAVTSIVTRDASDLSQGLGDAAVRHLEDTQRKADEIKSTFPKINDDQARALGALRSREEVNLLLKFYHGDTRVYQDIVDKWDSVSVQSFGPQVHRMLDEIGRATDEANGLRAQSDPSWWKENPVEFGQWRQDNRNVAANVGVDEAASMAASKASDDFEVAIRRLSGLETELRGLGEAAAKEAGYSLDFLATVFDFKSNLMYGAIGRAAHLDEFGIRQFADFRREEKFLSSNVDDDFYTQKEFLPEVQEARGREPRDLPGDAKLNLAPDFTSRPDIPGQLQLPGQERQISQRERARTRTTRRESAEAKIEDVVSREGAKYLGFDEVSERAYLDRLTEMHHYSLGTDLVRRLFDETPRNMGMGNIGAFDHMVTQSVTRRIAAGGSIIARPLNKLIAGKHRVFEYNPQSIIRFAEETSSNTQFSRYMDLLSDNSRFKQFGDEGALFTPDDAAEFKAAFNAADVNGRSRLYNQVANEAVTRFIAKLEKKYDDLPWDKLQGEIRKHIKKGWDEYFDKMRGRARSVNDQLSVLPVGDNTTVVLDMTPQMMQNTAPLARFDLMAKHISRRMDNRAARSLDQGKELLEEIQRYWKASVLIRPAYAARVLSDEKLRAIVTFGALDTIRSTFDGAQSYELARVQNRVRDIDHYAIAMDEARRSKDIAEALGVPVERLETLSPETMILRLAEQQKLDLWYKVHDDVLKTALKGKTKLSRIAKRAVGASAATYIGGPAGIVTFAALSLAKRHKHRLLGANYSRPAPAVVQRLTNLTTVDYFANALDGELVDARRQAQLTGNLDAFNRAERMIKARQADIQQVKANPDFAELSTEQIRALTIAEQAAVARHTVGMGHIAVGNVLVGSALGSTADMREINMRAVSAKSGFSSHLYRQTETLREELQRAHAAQMGIHTGQIAAVWDEQVNRLLTGFGEQTAETSVFTNTLWLAPGKQMNYADSLNMTAERLGVPSRASRLDDVTDPRARLETAREAYVDTVVEWLDGRGAAVLRDMPENAVAPEFWVEGLIDSVDRVVPNMAEFAEVRRRLSNGDRVNYQADINPVMAKLGDPPPDADDFVDVAALAQEMREGITDLSNSFNRAQRQDINEALLATRGARLDELFERGFNMVATRPIDELSRIPFFKTRYDQEVRRRIALFDTDEAGNVSLTADQVYSIEQAARRKALDDTRDVLFDLAERTRFGEAVALIMPFFDAWLEVAQRWTGLVVENPVQVARIVKNYRREQDFIVEDDEGNRYVTFRFGHNEGQGITLPKIPGLGGRLKDAEGMTLRFNVAQLNTLTQGMPGAGPMVMLPVNEIVRGRPDLQQQLSFLYPYGAPTGRFDNLLSAAPTSVRRLLALRDEDETHIRTFNGVLQNELTTLRMTGLEQEVLNDPLALQSFMDMVEQKTNAVLAVRVAAALVSPAQPQLVSPHQDYIEEYRRLRDADPETATDKFLDEYGDEYFWLTQAFTRNNTGIPAAQESYEQYKKYEDLIQAYPQFGGLIVGREGSQNTQFSEYVYNTQRTTRMSDTPGSGTQRELLSPEEFVETGRVRQGWRTYRQFNDEIDTELEKRGLVSIDDEGAEDLKYLRNRAVVRLESSNPEWRQAREENRGSYARNMRDLQTLASNPQLSTRSEFVALQEYFEMRDTFINELVTRDELGGSADINANSNVDVFLLWENYKRSFRITRLESSELWDRYLEYDLLGKDSWPDAFRERQSMVVQ